MAGMRPKFQRLGAVLLMVCAGVQVSCVGRDPSGKPALSTLKREMTPFSDRRPGRMEFNGRNELLILFLRPDSGHVDASEFDAEARRAGWTFERKRQSDFWSIAQYSKGRICLNLEMREGSPSEVTVSWSSNPASWNYCNRHPALGRTAGSE